MMNLSGTYIMAGSPDGQYVVHVTKHKQLKHVYEVRGVKDGYDYGHYDTLHICEAISKGTWLIPEDVAGEQPIPLSVDVEKLVRKIESAELLLSGCGCAAIACRLCSEARERLEEIIGLHLAPSAPKTACVHDSDAHDDVDAAIAIHEAHGDTIVCVQGTLRDHLASVVIDHYPCRAPTSETNESEPERKQLHAYVDEALNREITQRVNGATGHTYAMPEFCNMLDRTAIAIAARQSAASGEES